MFGAGSRVCDIPDLKEVKSWLWNTGELRIEIRVRNSVRLWLRVAIHLPFQESRQTKDLTSSKAALHGCYKPWMFAHPSVKKQQRETTTKLYVDWIKGASKENFSCFHLRFKNIFTFCPMYWEDFKMLQASPCWSVMIWVGNQIKPCLCFNRKCASTYIVKSLMVTAPRTTSRLLMEQNVATGRYEKNPHLPQKIHSLTWFSLISQHKQGSEAGLIQINNLNFFGSWDLRNKCLRLFAKK